MIRDLNWDTEKDCILDALSISPDRQAELSEFIETKLPFSNLQEIIKAVNERGDLNDSEWTAFMLAIGAHFYSRLGK